LAIRLLTFTTLYPDSTRPTHGIFVENRLRHLLGGGRVESRVVAPVPWFPSTARMFGEYARFAAVPRRETRHGIDVLHPRYLLVPKFGMTVAPFLMAAALRPVLRRIIRDGYDFDILDAHYFYPDGVAAVMLGRHFGKPVVITARGTDINLIPRYYFARRRIQWAARHAAVLITVCQALKDALVQLGANSDKITVLRNGVDLELFKPPPDRKALRKELGITGKTLLSVGNLISTKGHDLVIRALTELPGVRLMIAGQGPEEANLKRLAASLKVAGQVAFLGSIEHAALPQYYGASDALVLASAREGWPNVLLESLACGTPVITTRAGASTEIVNQPETGLVLEERSVSSLIRGISMLLACYPERALVRKHAERFSWDETTAGQVRLFSRLITEA